MRHGKTRVQIPLPEVLFLPGGLVDARLKPVGLLMDALLLERLLSDILTPLVIYLV
jgi:hypothetical protein